MKIDSVDVLPVDVPLRSRFVISTGDLSASGALGRLIVRLRTEDGVVGYGEAVAIPTVMGFTVQGLASALHNYLIPAIVGHDLADIAGLHRRMAAAIVGNSPAKAAIDIAAHDALGRATGVSVAELLGGKVRDGADVTKSVGSDIPERLRDTVAGVVEDGYPVVKLKLECSAVDADRVAAAAEVIDGRVLLRLDANAGYPDASTAIEAMRDLIPHRPYLVEQPVEARDLAGMAEFRAAVGIPVLADESVADEVDVSAVIRHSAADVVDVKIQAAGGLYPAMRAARLADQCGIPVIVGSRMETGIGAAACLQFIAALPRNEHACDLKGPDTYVDDLLTSPLRIQGGHAYVPVGAGLGVDVDEGQLSRYASSS